MRKGAARREGNYTNPCLTLHQPWASLLVHGIKRIEGRSWSPSIRGRLWIHAASRVPDEATIKAMEEFYKEIYAVNGITNIRFPEDYPVSRLLGCVEVVGCLRCEELAQWEVLPEGVRLEGQTDFCWLCEQPKQLLVPLEMRGYQRVYNLEKKIYEAAVKGLVPVDSPAPVKFPLPNPSDPFSLKPGSISASFLDSKASDVEKSSRLSAAISGARAAAMQFSKDQNLHKNTIQNNTPDSTSGKMQTILIEDNRIPDSNLKEGSIKSNSALGECNCFDEEGSSSHNQPPPHLEQHPGAPFTVVIYGLGWCGLFWVIGFNVSLIHGLLLSDAGLIVEAFEPVPGSLKHAMAAKHAKKQWPPSHPSNAATTSISVTMKHEQGVIDRDIAISYEEIEFAFKALARKVPSGSSPRHLLFSHSLSLKLQVVPNRVVEISPPPPPTPRSYITMLAPAPSPSSVAGSSP
ncbi:hypothetical protein PTKIN_Ptkin01aG0348900 [Pterospermum kingtungense]